MSSSFKMTVVSLFMLTCVDARRVTRPSAQLAAEKVAEKAAKINASAIEESSRIQAENTKVGQGDNCCCLPEDKRHNPRGNPEGLRGYCPAGMCTMLGHWPWQMDGCSAKHQWKCFKRPMALGCLFPPDKPPMGYQLSADPISRYSSIEASMREFVCPEGCHHCCAHPSKRSTNFLCMNDLKPDSNWRSQFPELSDKLSDGGRECKDPTSKEEEAGWSMSCKYSQDEIANKPWDHGINQVYVDGGSLDEEPCKYSIGRSAWTKTAKQIAEDLRFEGKLYEEARIATLEAMVTIAEAVKDKAKCVKAVGNALKPLIKSKAFKPSPMPQSDLQEMVGQAYENPKVYEPFGGKQIAKEQLEYLVGKGEYEYDEDGWMRHIIGNSHGHYEQWCKDAVFAATAKERELQAAAQEVADLKARQQAVQETTGETLFLRFPNRWPGESWYKLCGGEYEETTIKSPTPPGSVWVHTGDDEGEEFRCYLYKAENAWYVNVGDELIKDNFNVAEGILRSAYHVRDPMPAMEAGTWSYWSKLYDSYQSNTGIYWEPPAGEIIASA